MTEPTPRPWHQDEHGIIGPTGMVARSVAKCSKNLTPQPSYANARHIVKCVNAHDKLVAFVREADEDGCPCIDLGGRCESIGREACLSCRARKLLEEIDNEQ